MNPLLMRPTGIGPIADRIIRSARGVRDGEPIAGGMQPRLRDVNFGCPWPLRESPHLEAARDHALAWMVEFGLVKDAEANERMYRDWKLGESAAWNCPDGTADGVNLMADLLGWYFAPFDDQFDGELGRDPAGSARIIQDLIDILDLPEGARPAVSYPIALSFADVWRRSCRHMSPAWRQRAAHHWKEYLVGQLGEVVNRVHRRKPDAESQLRQRVATTSARVVCDLIESATGFEVPPTAWHMPVMAELRQLTAELISITNDLVSAEKEEAAGDIENNLLLILEHQEGYSRPEAVEKLRQMTHERFERFLRLEQQVPDIDDVLDREGRVALRRYVQGLHDFLAADNEWEHTSGRYVVDRPAQPREQDPLSVAAIPRGLSGAAALAARLPPPQGAKAPEPAPAAPVLPPGLPAPTALKGLGTSAARLFALPSDELPRAE